MWTTMGWEGAGFASTPWKMMRAASLSNHVCAGKWDNFFLLSLYPSIYIFSFSFVLWVASHTLCYIAHLATRTHHTRLFEKKSGSQELVHRNCLQQWRITNTNQVHATPIFFFAFFSPSFSPSFSLFFWCDKWYHLAHVPPNTTRVVNVHNRWSLPSLPPSPFLPFLLFIKMKKECFSKWWGVLLFSWISSKCS